MGVSSLMRSWSDWFRRRRAARRAREERETLLWEAADRIVDAADPNIKSLRHYRRRLQPAAQCALAYTEELAARIPGPLEISLERWKTDPVVNLLFVQEKDLVSTFTRGSEMERYFQQADSPRACALLTMSMSKKTVFVTESRGEIIRRDVARTSVTFRDHKLSALAPDEAGTRAEIRKQGLETMALLARGRIEAMGDQREELEQMHTLLHVKLRGLESGGRSGTPDAAEAAKVKQRLAQVERDLSAARRRLISREDHLDMLNDLLCGPERCLILKPISLRLDEYGIVVEDDRDQTGSEVELAELTMGREAPRAAMLTTFSRDGFAVAGRPGRGVDKPA